MKRIVPTTKHRPVDPEATKRLQQKLTEAKAIEERQKFWAKVQESKQPKPSLDLEALPIG